VECKNKKVIPVTTGANWNHFKITQTIPEPHIGRARNQETTKKNSHIGHCTHTAGSANVKVQNIFHGRNNITCSTDCTHTTAVTLYTLETWFVSGTYCKYPA